MTARLVGNSSPSLRDVLEAVKSLAPADQARLRDELANLSQVYIEPPDPTKTARRRGQRLAEQLRSDLQEVQTGELELAMSQLRGREWSS